MHYKSKIKALSVLAAGDGLLQILTVRPKYGAAVLEDLGKQTQI